ncbi:hypothetical protein ACJ5NV_06220 [Loktanella agnita]|uniref:hypothetical protein n=1 Tax=Loktanella agnita TaxID=287097 RepID=UPI00398747F0
MNNTLKLSVIIAIGVFATTASAECTESDIQAKTTEISTGMQSLAASDPEKMMEVSNELQAAMTAAAEADDVEAVCTSLDDILADMNS